MSVDATTPARVVEDARLLLRTVRDEVEEGRRPYMSDIRRLVERGLALKFPAYVQFLERYGFLTLDRRADLLAVTRAGEAVITGREGRLKSLEDDARYHFGEQLHEAPAPKRRSTGVRLDTRYLRLESIGRGGLGRVWRGRLLSVDRPVAIKMLDAIDEMFRPDQRERVARRFERAVREHAQLVSPYIVQIIDQNAQHDPPYFVMELAPGGNLKGLLERGPLAPPVALRYFIQIALGLKAAHALGVVHRDLKPENVLLDAAGNVKLSDFGVTRVAERDGATMRRAYVGYGSVGYMAPELLRGEAEGSPASDVYALGILLYEMLTGSLPGRRSPLPSDVVDGLPTAVDEIFDHMARDDIEGRLSSIDAVLDAVYGDDSIRALLDVRGAPGFIDPPLPLPGLPEGELPEGGDDEARDLAPTPPPSGVAPPEERPVSASRPPERVGDRPVDRPRPGGREAGASAARPAPAASDDEDEPEPSSAGFGWGDAATRITRREELEGAPAEAAAPVEARRPTDAGGWALPDEAPASAAASARTVLIDVAELTARRDDDAPRTDPPAAFTAPAADDGGDEEAGSVDDDADDDGSAFGADRASAPPAARASERPVTGELDRLEATRISERPTGAPERASDAFSAAAPGVGPDRARDEAPSERPSAAYPAVERPSAAAPAVERPASAGAAERPSSSYPATERPSGPHAATERSSSSYAATECPSGPHAATERPSSSYAATERPAGTASAERPSSSSAATERPSGSSAATERVSSSYAATERPSGSSAATERVSSSYAATERPSGSYAAIERPSTPPAEATPSPGDAAAPTETSAPERTSGPLPAPERPSGPQQPVGRADAGPRAGRDPARDRPMPRAASPAGASSSAVPRPAAPRPRATVTRSGGLDVSPIRDRISRNIAYPSAPPEFSPAEPARGGPADADRTAGFAPIDDAAIPEAVIAAVGNTRVGAHAPEAVEVGDDAELLQSGDFEPLDVKPAAFDALPASDDDARPVPRVVSAAPMEKAPYVAAHRTQVLSDDAIEIVDDDDDVTADAEQFRTAIHGRKGEQAAEKLRELEARLDRMRGGNR